MGSRGLTSSASIAQEGISPPDVPARRDILGWLRAFAPDPDPEAFAGRSVEVMGFVYRDEEMAADQFMVARFLILCCCLDKGSTLW